MIMKNFIKKFISLFFILLISSFSLFAEDMDDDIEIEQEDTDSNDDFYYTPNISGDQYIKLGLMFEKPLNFGDKMKIGGSGEIGYHRFLTSNIALGFDVQFGYNPTIGENVYTYIPLLIAFTYQPTFKNFEFPITLSTGAAFESYLNRSYFPGWTLRGSAGVFYRMSQVWSFGIEGEFMYMPEFYSNSKYNDFGTFAAGKLSIRYHF